MEYTVQKLGRIAGVSTRTLRFYDKINLLKPTRINTSGYRIYSSREVDQLQQILFYRELGVSLEQIKEIMESPEFDELNALKQHREQLLQKRDQLELLITNIDKTIARAEGRITMKDNEKFEGFKQRKLDENEQKYGKEIREKYGDDAVEKFNKRYMGISEKDQQELDRLSEELTAVLAEAYKNGDPSSELAQRAADLHKQWLCYYWPEYSKDAHAGLAQMYVDDERFTAYYDVNQPGTAQFLRDAIHIYTGFQKQEGG